MEYCVTLGQNYRISPESFQTDQRCPNGILVDDPEVGRELVEVTLSRMGLFWDCHSEREIKWLNPDTLDQGKAQIRPLTNTLDTGDEYEY